MSFNRKLLNEMIEESKRDNSLPKYKVEGWLDNYAKKPIVNKNGYLDGEPPAGSNWRIPGNKITMDLPGMPNEILAVSDKGEKKRVKKGEEATFNNAEYVDEYSLPKAQKGLTIKSYNPNLGKKDREFLDWYFKNTLEGQRKIPFNSSEQVYDFYSYFKNTPKSQLSNPEAHFPDTYKYPNHPTFSNESIYSTPENPGGYWKGEKYFPKGKFIYNKKHGGDISIPNLEEGNWLNRYDDGGPLPKAQKGKQLPPIYTGNPRDPRLRAYQDSLNLYNSIKKYSLDTKEPITAYSQDDANYLKLLYPNNKVTTVANIKLDPYTKSILEEYGRKTNFVAGKNYSQKELSLELNKAEQYRNKVAITPFTRNRGNMITDDKGVALRNTKIAPIGLAYGDMSDKDNWNSGLVTLYKKPVQPVVYQKQPEEQDLKIVGQDRVQSITPSFNINTPARLSTINRPKGNYAVDYFNEDLQPQTNYFPTPEIADMFMKERMKNKMYGPSMTRRGVYKKGGQTNWLDKYGL